MNARLQRLKYIVLDYLAAALAWISFFTYRKLIIEPDKFGYKIPLYLDKNLILGSLLIPLCWILLYILSGTYKNIYRKSRLKEIILTLNQSAVGVLLVFFFLLLDDEVNSYKAYYKTVITLFLLHFIFTGIFRLLLTTRTKYRISSREIGFNTLLIGSNLKAVDLYNELENERYSQGYKLVGFVTTHNDVHHLENKLPNMGHYAQLEKIIRDNKVEEVIIAIETSEHGQLNDIISKLEDLDIYIKIIPDMYDIISGTVKMTHIFGTALIEIRHEIMPEWQQNMKRFLDISFSLIVLIFFSPVYILIGLIVKLTSKGPVFYKQERIGLHGNPFFIYKFRSMYVNSESAGPLLSSSEDKRVTKIGKWLRKYRLDELPQFYNVLIGEMSLVGPRPERTYFIEQITRIAPHYNHLHKVKPGITSWGQVKYGYAENVEQMVERLKFDILYIENMSLAVDFRILFYTVLIILQGRGK